MGQKLTADRVLRVSVEPTEGSRFTFTSPNWADPTTWFYKSTAHAGVELTDSGDGLTFSIDPQGDPVIVIDNLHGKYTDEDILTTESGVVPRAVVYASGVQATEKDPHDNTGDYVVDYDAGTVTFDSPPAKPVTMDYWESGSSEFVIKPAAGKKLKIVYVEAQFSGDVSIRDSLHFEAWGHAGVFAPAYVPVPYAADDHIQLKETIYKTMRDYVNEANGTLNTSEGTTHGSPTWRDETRKIITYPWHYQAVTALCDSMGMEIRIKLEHDTPFEGFATATFYCLSVDET
jgi:hypothetical protein